METFSALLAICAGNSPVSGEFPAQRPVTRSVDVFFDLRLKQRLSKQSWGWWFVTLSHPLWRHCNGISQHCPQYSSALVSILPWLTSIQVGLHNVDVAPVFVNRLFRVNMATSANNPVTLVPKNSTSLSFDSMASITTSQTQSISWGSYWIGFIPRGRNVKDSVLCCICVYIYTLWK